jgi:uncharacterized protein
MPWLKPVRSTGIKYIDTSVLYDFYIKGTRTKKVQTFINHHQGELTISLWVKTEFYGALGRRVRDGALPSALAERAAQRFENHHLQGLYAICVVNSAAFEQAALLTRRFKLGIKSPDALHLAIAKLEGLELITSDQALANTAKQLQLPYALIK